MCLSCQFVQFEPPVMSSSAPRQVSKWLPVKCPAGVIVLLESAVLSSVGLSCPSPGAIVGLVAVFSRGTVALQ